MNTIPKLSSLPRDGNIFNEEDIRAGFEIVEALQREVEVFVTNRVKEADALEKARDPATRAELDQQPAEVQKWRLGCDDRTIAAITGRRSYALPTYKAATKMNFHA
ncbi:hypothetical protein [Pandoraea terrae]|uniref:hypothetical protein n=1 Tax=Pandoraea terrae TaxID=1537710 RepID=UPI001241175E|nr:hypothetical protein [Pandoraea terrae]